MILFDVFSVIFLLILTADSNSEAKKILNDNEFDVLIFTQHWPVTFCYTWMEKNKNNECLFPPKKDSWTIHGIWPTKFNTIGPSFCNRTWEFDMSQLESILPDLEKSWLNIEKGTPVDSLWSHEWNKHGTCAAQLSELDDENKYFSKGLSWLQEYEMSFLLEQEGITPGSDYSVIHIYKSLKKALNKNMAIECIYDGHSQTSYLFEIRICFDKNLDLTDCDGIVSERDVIGLDYPDGKIITNCDMEKLIRYPAMVPQIQKNPQPKPIDESSTWQFPFVKAYKLIQWIKRFTI